MAPHSDIPEELNPKALKVRTPEGIKAIDAQWPACENWFKDNLQDTVLLREMERVLAKWNFQSEKDHWAWHQFRKHMIDALCTCKAHDNPTKANVDDDAVHDFYTGIAFFKYFVEEPDSKEKSKDAILLFDPVKRLLARPEEDK